MNYTGPAILIKAAHHSNANKVGVGSDATAAAATAAAASAADLHYYDLYHGVEVFPQDGAIHLNVEARGYGAILATTATPTTDAALATFLKTMAAMTATPLETYSPVWTFLQQQEKIISPTKPMTSTPANMVPIPGGAYRFAVSGVEIEGSDSSLYNN